MAGQFDAVARISLDIRAFTAGAQQVTRTGGAMEQVFHNLNNAIGSVGKVSKTQAAELNRALGVYQKITGVVRSYVAMIQALTKAESDTAKANESVVKTFESLRGVLSKIRGLGEKEFDRVQRTLTLYTQMATVLQRLAAAQNQMTQATQRAQAAAAAEAKERDRAKKAATDQTTAEERLAQATARTAAIQVKSRNDQAIANQRLAQSAARTAAIQTRAASDQAIAEQRLAQAKARTTRSATEQAIANQRLAQATANAAAAQARANAVQQRAVGQVQALTRTQQQLTQATVAAAQAQQRAAQAATLAATAQRQGGAAAVRAQQRAAQAADEAARAQQRLAQAQQAAARAQELSNRSLRSTRGEGNLLRQDLSELETAYRRLSQTSVEAVQSVLTAAIDHESAFAQLARVTKVTGTEAEQLKRQFEELATTEPVSFEDVARVGQLAAQTGVAKDQLQQFSRTVVQFSVTTGIASDQVAVLFARIAEMQDIPTQDVRNFASMVLAVGTASAATETEILKVTQAISTSAVAFGLTTQDVGGLSGALASLRVPPEWARGTTTRIFRELDDAVKSSGAELGILTDVMGLTTQEIKDLRSTDPGEFFRQFIKGMEQFTDTAGSAEEATASVANVLRSLGVGAVRDIEFVARLAANFDLLASQTDLATVAFSKNTELTEQTGILYDTARVKIDNMIDAFENFLAGVGKDIVIVLGDIASFTTGMIETFREVPTVFKGFLTGATAVLAFAAALTALRAVAFQSLRSLVAMRAAQQQLGVQSLTLRNIFRSYRDTVNGATGSNERLQRSYAGNIRAARQEQLVRRESINSLNEQARAAQSAAQTNQRLALAQANAARQEIQAVRDRAAAGSALASDSQRLVTQYQRLNESARRYAVATTEATAATQRLGTVSNVATTGMAGRLVGVGAAARVAASGVTLLGAAFSSIAIGVIITGLVTLYQTLTKVDNTSQEAAQAAFDAAGGLTALGDAIAADTKAAAEGEGAIRKLTTASANLTDEERRSAEERRENAKAEQTRIEALFGSIDALRKQAAGTDEAAKRARGYVAEWDSAENTINQVTAALDGATVALGENAQAFLENTVRQTVMTSETFKTADALKALTDNSDVVQKALSTSLKDPAAAAKLLQDEIDVLVKKIGEASRLELGGFIPEESSVSLTRQANALDELKNSLTLVDGSLKRSSLLNALFEESAGKAGAGADELTEALEGTDDASNALAGDIQAMASALTSALDPMKSLQVAFEEIGFENAFDFAAAFRAGKIEVENLRKSFQAFTTDMLNQITATRDWERNLVRAVNELSPEVAKAFRDMGVDAAPLLAEALTLKGDARAKFVAQMEVFGKAGQEAFASAVTAGQAAIEGKGTETGRLFADATANALNQAVKPGGSVQKAAKSLEVLGDLISKDVITKEVALDLEKFRGDADELQSFALKLVQSGRLDITAAAQLVTALYTGSATDLASWVTAQNAVGAFDLNGDAKLDASEFAAAVAGLEAQVNLLNASDALDPQAEAKLSASEYDAEVQKLEDRVTLLVASGVLDPKAEAKLDPEQFKATMDALNVLAERRGLEGDFDANGDGKLDPAEYVRVLDFLKALAGSNATIKGLSPTGVPTAYPKVFQDGLNKLREWTGKWRDRLNGWMNPTPEVNQSAFNTDLNDMESSSWATGETIQANLTRTATVTVGYTYRQNNSPPAIQQAATGGWISGPGTPTSDSVPALLSDGEFVVSAKQAQRFGAVLEAINNGRFGRGYMNYATGGPVNVRRVGIRRMETGSGMIQRMPARSQVPRVSMIGGGGGPRITVNNHYPQAEPTSTTINRSLAYAATLNGV